MVWAAASLLLALEGVPEGLPATSVLHEGSAVALILDEDVSARAARVGRQVVCHVAADVHVDGCVVIPAGAPARLEVVRSVTGNFIGAPDRLVLRAVYATALNGVRVALRGEFALQGEDRMVESLASSQVIGCLFFLVPGDRVAVAKGTGWTAFVSHDMTQEPCSRP